MRGQTLQVRQLALLRTDRPQPVDSATKVENWRVDPATKGLSSRVGYEKYRTGAASKWAPFTSLGRIDSLFIHQQSAGGARQSILLEADGALYLYYEVGGAHTLHQLATRSVPTATAAPSQYASFGDRVVITNGVDAPIIVRPWPLPENASISATVLSSITRDLGFYGPPPEPQTLQVATIDATGTVASTSFYTGQSTTNWYTVHPLAINYAGLFGMGASTGPVQNTFRFKVAFISDTGSVSPLSTEAEVTWEVPTGHSGFRYAPTIRLPLGPPGTVARRVYATLSDGADFYFVADVRNNVDVVFHAFRRSDSFSVAAPAPTDSVPFPAPRARCCAIFKDCLFLDGGANQGNVLFYSRPGLVDQFGAGDYLTLTSGGGAITGLYAYYNNLIIFRENSVDVLTGSYPSFSVQTVTKQVVCRAPSSVEAVPGLGVVFLAEDGVYALTGGLDGGAVFDVLPIGNDVQGEVERLTTSCSARAVARYSPVERAYHLYLPVDGSDRPNLGLVYHLDKRGWSTRVGFPVGCIDRTFDGAMVFGHHTGVAAGADQPAGLFVLSAARYRGGKIVADTWVKDDPPTSTYESAWHDFGDAQVKKQVQYVTLWVYTTGDVTLTMSYWKDFEYAVVDKDERYKAQPPDQADQPVLDSAVLDTDAWQDTRLVPIRIAVSVQSCSWFKFGIETTDDLLIVGYELEFVARGTQVTAGKLA